jgi:hypothetical protein
LQKKRKSKINVTISKRDISFFVVVDMGFFIRANKIRSNGVRKFHFVIKNFRSQGTIKKKKKKKRDNKKTKERKKERYRVLEKRLKKMLIHRMAY